ncbi:MAG: hypothetical protein WCO06_06875, partial [Candidatus Roizmanbacteria bacterium]
MKKNTLTVFLFSSVFLLTSANVFALVVKKEAVNEVQPVTNTRLLIQNNKEEIFIGGKELKAIW